MPLMTTEEVLRNGGCDGVHAALLGLPTDAIVPGIQYGRGTVGEHMRFVKELTKDITPEQWAEMAAATKAAKRENCCMDAHDGELAVHSR